MESTSLATQLLLSWNIFEACLTEKMAEAFLISLKQTSRKCKNANIFSLHVLSLVEAKKPLLTPLTLLLLLKCSWGEETLDESLLVLIRSITAQNGIPIQSKEDEEECRDRILQLLEMPYIRPIPVTLEIRVFVKSLAALFNLIPALRLSVYPHESIVQCIKGFLQHKDHFGAVRTYELFLPLSDIHLFKPTLVHACLQEKEYDCVKSILSWKLKSAEIISEDIRLTRSLMNICIDVNEKASLELAVFLGSIYRKALDDITGRAASLLKKSKIEYTVNQGKWQIALRWATSRQLRIFLYNALLARELYQEARSVYTQLGLEGLVPSVREEHIQMQAELNQSHYLSFPPDMIIVVVSNEESLARAGGLLRLLQEDGSLVTDVSCIDWRYRVFGLDAEWATTSVDSASILQVKLYLIHRMPYFNMCKGCHCERRCFVRSLDFKTHKRGSFVSERASHAPLLPSFARQSRLLLL